MATVTQHPTKSGRGAELVLLALALLITCVGFSAVSMSLTDLAYPSLTPFIALFVISVLLTHVVIRKLAPFADPVLLPLAVTINGVGMAMIYRIDFPYAKDSSPYTIPVGPKQLIISIVGIFFLWAVLFFIRDHRILRGFSYISMALAIIFLALPFLPGIGSEQFGSKIWIDLGFTTFQPAEIAKILLAIFFAGYLERHRDNLALAGKKILGIQLPRARDVVPLFIIWIASIAVLVFQKDLGTSLLLFALFVAMLYVATDRPSWIIMGTILTVPIVMLALKFFSHAAARFDIWLHAFDPQVFNRDPGGSGQLVRGLFGMASGGLFGTGFGRGYPDLVPSANADFIIASLGEELGLTGLVAILLMYTLLCERGIRAAIGVKDGFGKLLATGFSFLTAFQVFIVVGGVTRLIPLTGLTTPFLASGGSSLISSWIILGLLLRISHAARAPGGETSPATVGATPSPAASSLPHTNSSEDAKVPADNASPSENTAVTERVSLP
ncbi:MAG: FtsW/RodA/SpoVE family cell cycle protein [Actinomycetaceae bacterium]|nr:FtsW/RodA/SpoVE family cell cycle protein [Actinomycetaceae bacterium]